jgi:hypothetical protein
VKWNSAVTNLLGFRATLLSFATWLYSTHYPSREIGRRIQSIQTLIEIDTNFIVRVQWPGNANQYLREIRKDPPIMRPAGKPAQPAVALIALNATAKLSIGKEAD